MHLVKVSESFKCLRYINRNHLPKKVNTLLNSLLENATYLYVRAIIVCVRFYNENESYLVIGVICGNVCVKMTLTLKSEAFIITCIKCLLLQCQCHFHMYISTNYSNCGIRTIYQNDNESYLVIRAICRIVVCVKMTPIPLSEPFHEMSVKWNQHLNQSHFIFLHWLNESYV